MLPFQSRNVRHSEEELSTDDVEVVQHVRNAARVAPSSNKFGTTLRSTGVSSDRAPASSYRRNPRSDRPQVPAPIPASTRAHHVPQQMEAFSESDDEMTCLMPSKMILPPTSKRSNEMRSMEFRPQPQSRRAQPMRSPSTPQPMRSVAARQESMISHSDSESVIHHHIPAPPASLAPMAMPSVDSDHRFNPGATVLTSRSLAGRPTVSWAAALVVMGIFAGLVTAAVARGDLAGDAKVAAASQPAVQQVIPSQMPATSPAANPAAGLTMGSLYSTGTTSSMAVSSPINVAPVAQPVVAQQPIVQSQPVVQQPVAVAAKFTPAPRVVSRPRAAAPAPVVHVAAADPKPEVKEEKVEKKVATKSKSKGDDLASAKEAQALADAQLAASL